MVTTARYSKDLNKLWNDFVSISKNGVFLFDRNYMDYHADRFIDNSIIVLDDGGKPLSLFPANRKEDLVVSHGGLTFGGIISDDRMIVTTMMDVFQDLMKHLKEAHVKKLVYKAIPHIYHSVPAEEDLYALFRLEARLVRRDVSSTILMADRMPFVKERRWCVRKGLSQGTKVEPSVDFSSFMEIEEKNLESRHGVRPTHTKEEMILLASRFPENIRLFAAMRDGRMEGGVIVYEYKNVAHTQYIASTEEGRKTYAVDCVLDYLINEHYINKRYFDFGISTEKAGRYLNPGLSDYKSTFGARTTVYDTYEIKCE